MAISAPGAEQQPSMTGRLAPAMRLLAKDRGLWIVLGIGLLLRLIVMVSYTPAVFNYYGGDEARYMRLSAAGVQQLFGDVAMPAGYPAFLAGIRGISSWLPLTTFLQHLIGLGAAALLYFAVRRTGAPRWAALLPAIILAISGDQIYLEHALLTEALWVPLLALGLFAAIASLTAPRPGRWLVAAGAILMLSALVRNVSLVMPLVVAIWAWFALAGPLRSRLLNAVWVIAPAVALLVLYLVVAGFGDGGRNGLFEDQGLALYGRVAQFADCSQFTPPKGTEVLCVTTPEDEREGPFYWTFSPESPLREKFHFDINDEHEQEMLSEFGKDAIIHQPRAYARAVLSDLVRFFAPEVGEVRAQDGVVPRQMSFGSNVGVNQAWTPREMAEDVKERYSGVGSGEASHFVRNFLGSFQAVFRVVGIILLALILLNVVGVIWSRGKERAAAILFFVVAAYLLVIAPATSSYDARYAIPPADFFAAGAAFGLVVLVRWAGRRGGGSIDQPVTPTAARN
jgi:hypothetical protein